MFADLKPPAIGQLGTTLLTMTMVLSKARFLYWLLPLICTLSALPTQADDSATSCMAAYEQAQELRLEGALLAAHEQLLLCSRRSCAKPILDDCSGWLAEVEKSLSSLVFAVTDEHGNDLADVRVLVGERLVLERTDGRAVQVDPGAYEFRFEAAGYVTVKRVLLVHEFEQHRIVRVQLTALVTPVASTPAPAASTAVAPPSGSHSTTVTTWPVVSVTLGSAGLASAGSFAYFGLQGKAARVDAENCTASCRSLIDAGKRDYLAANISLAVAIAAATSAVLVYWLVEAKQTAPATERSSRLRPTAF